MPVPSIYQHPLAYLLGLEGVALMRAFAGDHDRQFTLDRIAEARSLLDRAEEFGDGVEIPQLPATEGYDGWSARYDTPDNPFFAMDEAVLLPVLDALPAGVAVDAACGTGRYAVHLAARGHEVHGFDTSPGMLGVAGSKVPGGRFGLADMGDLPLPDDSADVVVNALAVNHVEDLDPVFAEAARVLRPGGHLLVSDVRGYFTGSMRTPLLEYDARGGIGYVPAWSHPTGDYLRAGLRAGLTVRDCQELVAEVRPDEIDDEPAPLAPGEPASIWELHPFVPAAAHAVRDDRPCLITWHFQLPR